MPARHQYRITVGEDPSSRGVAHCFWHRIQGDFIATAEAVILGPDGSPVFSGRFGWSARNALDEDTPAVDACVAADDVAWLNGDADRADNAGSFQVIQLERRGDTFIFSRAKFGAPLTSRTLPEQALGDEVFLTLMMALDEPSVPVSALFRNVRIVRPAPESLVPYRDYIGSHLEILHLATGQREIVHTVRDSLQAPNWTPDGRFLIYNRNGRLYRFSLETRQTVEIPSGFATDNNNDHVLSPDGRLLGISHHDAGDDGRSHIYTLRIEGGLPRKVTRHGPSYLHGWSPDGKHLIYTAGREGRWNIYRIPVEGGAEEALTDSDALNDGSEYAPDGRFIYFNSTRSGAMRLWRMRADGSDPEQLTDDGFNDWFPHLSPDGREIVFLSYLPEIAPSEHPFYQPVYLRRMPVDGGVPTVVAYLYGGQGTLNVPSWSPDGRSVAFVSNTVVD